MAKKNKNNLFINICILIFCILFFGAGGGLIHLLTGLKFVKSVILMIGIAFLTEIYILFFEIINNEEEE